MSDLQDRIVAANLRWHNRSTVRKWPDAGPSPFGVEFSGGENETEHRGAKVAMSVLVGTTDDGSPVVQLRAAVQLNDDRRYCLQDCEVRFHLSGPGVEPTDDELRTMVAGWGAEYILGYLRGALADGARSVGLAAPVLPTAAHVMSPDEIDALIATARESHDG